MGTLEYLPPEVLLGGPATTAADVYALAVTLNEVATGVVPFSDCTKDNPACQTVLNFGYGRHLLSPAPFHQSHTHDACGWLCEQTSRMSQLAFEPCCHFFCHQPFAKEKRNLALHVYGYIAAVIPPW